MFEKMKWTQQRFSCVVAALALAPSSKRMLPSQPPDKHWQGSKHRWLRSRAKGTQCQLTNMLNYAPIFRLQLPRCRLSSTTRLASCPRSTLWRTRTLQAPLVFLETQVLLDRLVSQVPRGLRASLEMTVTMARLACPGLVRKARLANRVRMERRAFPESRALRVQRAPLVSPGLRARLARPERLAKMEPPVLLVLQGVTVLRAPLVLPAPRALLAHLERQAQQEKMACKEPTARTVCLGRLVLRVSLVLLEPAGRQGLKASRACRVPQGGTGRSAHLVNLVPLASTESLALTVLKARPVRQALLELVHPVRLATKESQAQPVLLALLVLPGQLEPKG
mmetsp:Transcript_26961/g.62102  ORF Transcript_26961/g.62102 Transcript_26961/m.62102 type:complete len:337 (-) Transcript_26961:481-1491(-)